MKPIVVKVLSQRGAPNESLLASHMPGNSLEHGDVRFTTRDEPADVVVVLNYLKYDARISARQGYIWCWHNEPIVRKPFPKGFDQIFTHEESSDPRAVKAPPILDWWLEKSWDQLWNLQLPKKSANLSAIASTKEMIPGHAQRNAFIRKVETALPSVPVFGEGRRARLKDKWDGLAPYKYSMAIENSNKRDYWSEKIADCFLSFTVPLYFGAENIGDYFPENSYIWLPIDEPEKAVQVIKRTLADDSFDSRLQAVTEARRRILQEYSLFAQLCARVQSEAEEIRSRPLVKTLVQGRRIRPGGWVRGVGPYENLRIQSKRFRSRWGNST